MPHDLAVDWESVWEHVGIKTDDFSVCERTAFDHEHFGCVSANRMPKSNSFSFSSCTTCTLGSPDHLLIREASKSLRSSGNVT
jgi:hypothetical protein